jgi:hypothetical protein
MQVRQTNALRKHTRPEVHIEGPAGVREVVDAQQVGRSHHFAVQTLRPSVPTQKQEKPRMEAPDSAAGTYSALPAMQTCTSCASGATGAVGAKSSSECGCKQIGYTNRENKQTYIITVSQFAFYIDGERRAPIKLYSPGIYTFDQSDDSNNNHLFTFKDALGRIYETGLYYYHGIPGQPGAYTSLTMLKSVQASLHYVCAAHGNFMGNTLNLSDEVVCSCQAGYGLPTALLTITAQVVICQRNHQFQAIFTRLFKNVL